jgi:hypothetical protein
VAIYNINKLPKKGDKRAPGFTSAQGLAAQVAKQQISKEFTPAAAAANPVIPVTAPPKPAPVEPKVPGYVLPPMTGGIEAKQFDPGDPNARNLSQAAQDSIASKSDISGRVAPPAPPAPPAPAPAVLTGGLVDAAVAATSTDPRLNPVGPKVGAPIKTNAQLQEEAIRRLLEGTPDAAAERKAMQDQLAVNQARDIQSIRARTGLGGMGLTGAAGALESQVRQETGRESTSQLAEFDRANRKEAAERALAGIQAERGSQVYNAEVKLYESEADIDIDGDGMINGQRVEGIVGDGNAENNPAGASKETPEQKAARLDAERVAKREEADGMELRNSQWAGDPKVDGVRVGGVNYDIYTDNNGKKYKVRSWDQNRADTVYTNLG